MSYQLIYTSAPQLLDPSLSGYGVVARSEHMPRSLEKKLEKISGFKEDAKLISGAQFSYHILDCAGATFHVLSCVQSAGADYSGRECHIAHHLALTQEEVRSLRANKARPTPASIILGLYRDQFWKSEWKQQPQLISSEPRLSTDLLPDINSQTMWKELTGHKYNAKSLITPPYEHDCLIIVQSGTRSMDILHLLAESDWISTTRGWGITFTTTGVVQDTFAQTQRIAVLEESALAGKARRSGRPTLRLEHKLLITREQELLAAQIESQQLAAASGTAASSILSHQGSSPPSSTSSTSISQRAERAALLDEHLISQLPYKYIEPKDQKVYHEAASSSRRLIVICAALLTTALLAVAAYYHYHTDDHSPHTTSDYAHDASTKTEKLETLPPHYTSPLAQSSQDIHSINEQLSILASLPYDSKQTSDELSELSALSLVALDHSTPSLQPKLQNLHHIIQQLRACRQEGCAHSQNIASLVNYCLDVGLDLEAIIRLYLLHATQEVPAHLWANHLTEAQCQSIINTLHDKQLEHLFNEPQLFPYLHALDRHDPINRHYEAPDQQLDDIISTYDHLNSGGLVIINQDETIPLIIQNLFQRTSFLLDQGKIGIYPIDELPFVQRLQRSKYTILINSANTPYAQDFVLINKGVAEPSIEMRLAASSKFGYFLFQGKPTLLLLKLSASTATDRYLFLSHITFNITPKRSHIPLPDLNAADFLIRENDLDSLPPDSWQPYPQLRLADKFCSRYPWKTLKHEIELQDPPQIHIPHIEGFSPEISIDPSSERRSAISYSVVINNQPSSLFSPAGHRVQLMRNLDLDTILQRELYALTNSCATKRETLEPGFYTLANIYHILLSLDAVSSISEVEQLMLDYFKCYSENALARQMNNILSDTPALLLSPEDARGHSTRSKMMRAQYAELLSNVDTRILIRQHIRNHISQKLYQTYEQAKREIEETHRSTPPHKLELYKLEKKNSTLIWHFRLISTSTAS